MPLRRKRAIQLGHRIRRGLRTRSSSLWRGNRSRQRGRSSSLWRRRRQRSRWRRWLALHDARQQGNERSSHELVPGLGPSFCRTEKVMGGAAPGARAPLQHGKCSGAHVPGRRRADPRSEPDPPAQRLATSFELVEYRRAVQGGVVRCPAEHELVAAGRHLHALGRELGGSVFHRERRARKLELELPCARGAAQPQHAVGARTPFGERLEVESEAHPCRACAHDRVMPLGRKRAIYPGQRIRRGFGNRTSSLWRRARRQRLRTRTFSLCRRPRRQRCRWSHWLALRARWRRWLALDEARQHGNERSPHELVPNNRASSRFNRGCTERLAYALDLSKSGPPATVSVLWQR
jgi:hypothetical protein